jgi:transporter family protein
MSDWMYFSLIAVALWGIVGLLQKLGTNRISADSLLVWLMVGYLVLLPWLIGNADFSGLAARDIFVGILAGVTNGLGAWFLFAALEKGAKASIAVPLTALNPLVTILLALVFLAERLTIVQSAGVILAILAGVLISYEKRRLHGMSDDPL